MEEIEKLQEEIAAEEVAIEELKVQLEQAQKEVETFGEGVDATTLSPEDFERWTNLETQIGEIMQQLGEKQMRIVAMQRQVMDAKSGDGMVAYTGE